MSARAPSHPESAPVARATPEHAAPSNDPSENGLGFALPDPARPSPLRLALIGLLTLGVFGGAFLAAYLPRKEAERELQASAAAQRQARRRLTVVTPKLVSGASALRLPGSIQPLEETLVHARANGYVRRWAVDIGTRVQAGALLAEIETPELDQELAEARAALAKAQANLVQAEANRGYASSERDRTEKLVEAGLSPRQALDQTRAGAAIGDASVKVAEAAIVAERANVRRLTELREFARVTAPFAGVITARLVERGSLVTAGNATPLFRLSATDTVRVFVQVPQSVAPSVTVDMKARVRIREFPESPFEARVVRTAGALDAASRTLNTEIQIPNPDHKLLTGMYAEVELELPIPHRVFEVPPTALLNDAAGLRVAVVGAGDRITFRPISIERDLGPTVQIASGLDGTERIVQIASPDLNEGDPVDVIQ